LVSSFFKYKTQLVTARPKGKLAEKLQHRNLTSVTQKLEKPEQSDARMPDKHVSPCLVLARRTIIIRQVSTCWKIEHYTFCCVLVSAKRNQKQKDPEKRSQSLRRKFDATSLVDRFLQKVELRRGSIRLCNRVHISKRESAKTKMCVLPKTPKK
jgi:hypothetical protein